MRKKPWSFSRCARLLGFVVGCVTPAMALGEWRMNFPEPVTPIATETLHIHNLFMAIITVLFVVVFAIMVYSMFFHRKSRGYQAADFTGPRNPKQWFWVLIPFALLLFIDYVIFGIPAYKAVLSYEDTKSDAQMVIKVIGMQWRWQYEYPREGIKFVSSLTTPREQIENKAAKGEHYLLEVDNPLVIPVGKKIRFITTSTDVIHSWWVPAFGVKRDSIPGFLREFWVKVEKPGVYRGQCAELCGKDHGFMPVVVHAVTQEEFDRWVLAQKTAMAAQAEGANRTWSKEELMARGKEVYDTHCVACHQANGEGIPGAFPPIAGARIARTPFVDEAGRMIRDGHLDRVMNGKPGTAMQAFKDTLSDVDIAAVITYERNSFGNTAGDVVQPSLVKAMRAVSTGQQI